jgi:hypothetical protein
MEGWLLLSSLDQLRQYLRDLIKASGPAVHKNKRDGVLDVALLVDKMYLKRLVSVNCYVRCELRELIELLFCSSPVVATTPACYKSLYICEGATIVPFSFLKLIWEGRKLNFLLQYLELFLRDGNLVWRNGCHRESQAKEEQQWCDLVRRYGEWSRRNWSTSSVSNDMRRCTVVTMSVI